MNKLEVAVSGFSFLDKLITVYEQGVVDYWIDRKVDPNLTIDEFEQFLYRIDEPYPLKWVERNSEDGRYGKTGEDSCFKFNIQVGYGDLFGENEIKNYFIKGYFFDKDDLKGVAIQSFREE